MNSVNSIATVKIKQEKVASYFLQYKMSVVIPIIAFESVCISEGGIDTLPYIEGNNLADEVPPA